MGRQIILKFARHLRSLMLLKKFLDAGRNRMNEDGWRKGQGDTGKRILKPVQPLISLTRKDR
jgi:hypothetical protein